MEGLPNVFKETFGHVFGGSKPQGSFTADKIPDLTGKTIIVTGGNVGLGYASVLELAKHNAHVYVASRTPSKGEAAIADIKKEVPDARLSYLELDLTSFDSIKSAAEAFSAKESRLDILLNNAGIMAVPPGLTKQGYEIQFGTNHVGHALFTKLLLPTLLKTQEQSPDVRIVNVSSTGHKLSVKGGIVLSEVKTDMTSTSTWARYGQSKLANILFTRGLVEHYPQIKSVVVHPGVVNTNLSAGFQKEHPIIAGALGWWILKLLKTPADGALNQLFASTSSDAKAGVYYTPVGRETPTSPDGSNEKLVTELWDWTEKEFKEHGF